MLTGSKKNNVARIVTTDGQTRELKKVRYVSIANRLKRFLNLVTKTY